MWNSVLLAAQWLLLTAHGLKLRLPNEIDDGDAQGDTHLDMTTEELQFHFGVTHPQHVNATNYRIIQILPPKRLSKRNKAPSDFKMSAFGQDFKVPLRINDKMLKNFQNVQFVANSRPKRMSLAEGEEEAIEREQDRILEPEDLDFDLRNCLHYTHATDRMLGAISDCQGDGYRGFITDMEQIYEINPLGEKHRRGRGFHVVVRRDSKDVDQLQAAAEKVRLPPAAFKIENMMRTARSSKTKKTIEIALMVDYKATKIYDDLFRRSRQRTVNMILSVMNGVQAVYHFPSLGEEIDFSIVHLEFHDQYDKIQKHHGEQRKALINFCQYQTDLLKGTKT